MANTCLLNGPPDSDPSLADGAKPILAQGRRLQSSACRERRIGRGSRSTSPRFPSAAHSACRLFGAGSVKEGTFTNGPAPRRPAAPTTPRRGSVAFAKLLGSPSHLFRWLLIAIGPLTPFAAFGSAIRIGPLDLTQVAERQFPAGSSLVYEARSQGSPEAAPDRLAHSRILFAGGDPARAVDLVLEKIAAACHGFERLPATDSSHGFLALDRNGRFSVGLIWAEGGAVQIVEVHPSLEPDMTDLEIQGKLLDWQSRLESLIPAE